jgi:fido (protein-threonine AMPylation protein)
VSSEVNAGLSDPILFLGKVDVVRQLTDEDVTDADMHKKPNVVVPQSRVPGGKAFHFLGTTANFLSDKQLGGRGRRPLSIPGEENGASVTRFLVHSRAVETLRQASSWAAATAASPPPLSSLSTKTNDQPSTDNTSIANTVNNDQSLLLLSSSSSSSWAFSAALEEFACSQLDRQSSMLASHMSRHADRADAVVSQHRQALEAALAFGSSGHRPPLTVEVLCEWHGIICRDLSESAGTLRTKAVRVGHVSFRPSRFVNHDLKQACDALAVLEERLRTTAATALHDDDRLRRQQHEQQMPPQGGLTLGLQAALFGAIAYYAIVDTHAFSDGNGRLARIAGNFALRRFGFGIPICMFATPAQRKDFVRATVLTMRNLALLPRGEIEPHVLLEAHVAAGAFAPLLRLFLDRMERAVSELNRLTHDKQLASQEEAQHRAAKLMRERAASGTCLICFDNSPNVATLCCGKAVHLNCLAEWLFTKNSCPNCRGELPALPPHILHKPNGEGNDDDDGSSASDDETTSDTAAFSTFSESEDTTVSDSGVHRAALGFVRQVFQRLSNQGDNNGAALAQDDTFTTTEEEEEGIAAPAAASSVAAHSQQHDTMSVDDTTTDETSSIVADGGGNQQAASSSTRHNDNTAEDETTTDEDDDDGCRNCSNRAARDCENRLCGRCCQMVGHFQCARHQVFL